MFANDEEDFFRMSISKFENMLKTNKVCFFDSEEFENIILHYLDTGKLNLSKKALKLGLDQHPYSIGLKLVQVELLVFENKFDQAEKLLNEIQAIDTNNDEIYIQRSNIYSKKGEHYKAIDSLQLALQYTEDYADVYSLMGMEYLYLDELQAAKEAFIKCLKHDSSDHSSLFNVVYCFDFLDQNLEAVDFLETFIDENPYSEAAWHQLGRQYYTLKNFDKAVEAFDYACVVDEYFVGAYIEKGKALEKLKKYREAIECYKYTIKFDEPTAYLYHRIGYCFEALKKTPKALKYYLRSIQEDPLMDKSWIAIGDLYLKKNNFRKALHFVNKALEIDEQNHLYWRRFAIINKELMLYEEAALGFKKSIEHGDQFIDTWLFWADSLLITGEYYTAIEKLLQARNLFNDKFEIEYRLAGFYGLTQQTEKSLYHLTNGLTLDFGNRNIIERLFPNMWNNELVQKHIQKFYSE